MKEYLKALIVEQCNRGLSLKKFIPHPLEYSELESLADRCVRIIDENIEELNLLLKELNIRNKNDIRDVFRSYRGCARKIEMIEHFGIPALYYETAEIGYLNKLIRKIHREINLPLTPPAVACISTKYYYWHCFTNVIFVPLGESEFLLHLPDVFHEIGHQILYNREKELKLETIKEGYEESINTITRFYQKLHKRKKRETGPDEIPITIRHIHSQWKDYWIEEFFSDLFATYTIGPAYAWSHLHITTKKSRNIYSFSPYLPQRHPSDDARMKMILEGLTILGFKEEVEKINYAWESSPSGNSSKPLPEYQYAYAPSLLKKLASIFFKVLKKSNFSIISPEKLGKLDNGSVVKLLNAAWNVFWREPDNFRKWEEKNIEELKVSV